MPALDRKVEVTCGNCGNSVTNQKMSRQKSRCSGGTLYCPKCPNYSTTSKDDLNYHIAKKRSAAGPKNSHTCKECHAEIPGFYALRQHKNTQHGTRIGFGASNIDVENIVGDVDDQSSREEINNRVDNSWLILKYKKGDIVCSILLSTTLQLR